MARHTPDRIALFAFALPALCVVILGFGRAAGWTWDFLNGLGFAGLSGLIYLAVQGRARINNSAHQTFSYVVLSFVLIHCLGLLLLDSITLEYLHSGAPTYMWAGLLSAMLLALILFSALPSQRKKAFHKSQYFRGWHKYLSWLVMVTAVWHVLGSGFYLQNMTQYLVFSGLFLPIMVPRLVNTSQHLRVFSWLAFLATGVLLAAFISLGLNVSVK